MAKSKEAQTQVGAKNSWLLPVGIVLGVILLLALWIGGTYNSFVGLSEGVDGKWAQVETQYQRRFDLISNLVKTIKSQTAFEAQFITNLTALNTRWQTGSLNQKVEAAGALDALVSRILVAPATTYPAITSAEGYTALRDEWSNTENKIAVERGRYNEAVKEYNAKVKYFPGNLIAGMFGFSPKEYFQAASGTETTSELGALPYA